MKRLFLVMFAFATLAILSSCSRKAPDVWLMPDCNQSCQEFTNFVEELNAQGFTQSFSRVGNCWDNACIESFFGHLKAELGITHQKKLLSYAEMEQKIRDYIEYYRTKRVQARLAYRTPQEVLLEYQATLV